MGSGRCPGDMVTRVVRCCDTIFALLDQGRRFLRREAGESASPARRDKGWRPDLDPAGTADDFLPVLIYVVLRARVPRLHSMCEYVQAYHSPVALMSRWVPCEAFCLFLLHTAIEVVDARKGFAGKIHVISGVMVSQNGTPFDFYDLWYDRDSRFRLGVVGGLGCLPTDTNGTWT